MHLFHLLLVLVCKRDLPKVKVKSKKRVLGVLKKCNANDVQCKNIKMGSEETGVFKCAQD